MAAAGALTLRRRGNRALGVAELVVLVEASCPEPTLMAAAGLGHLEFVDWLRVTERQQCRHTDRDGRRRSAALLLSGGVGRDYEGASRYSLSRRA